jgi:hypothetical protein
MLCHTPVSKKLKRGYGGEIHAIGFEALANFFKELRADIVIGRFSESQDSQTVRNFFLSSKARATIISILAYIARFKSEELSATVCVRGRSNTNGEKEGFQNHRRHQ